MRGFAFEGVINFRDFGGYRTEDGGRVREGVLFRSAHFGAATENDIALLEQLGVRVVIDFRGPNDKEDEGHNRLPQGIREVLIPMYDPAQGNDPRVVIYQAPPHEVAAAYPPGRAFDAMAKASESRVMNPERARQFGQMLRTIIEADGAPIVIHCSAGKDRTGWGAAIVQLALGVPREDVIADYLLSNELRGHGAARLDELAAAGLDPALLEPFFAVHQDYIHRSLTTLDREYGGFEEYRRDALGVSDTEIERFVEVMVER